MPGRRRPQLNMQALSFATTFPVLGLRPGKLSSFPESIWRRGAPFSSLSVWAKPFLTTGRNTVEHMDADLTFPVFCSAFVSTVAMWWIYFHRGQEVAAERAEKASRPESVAHNLFTYGHLSIVVGIILTAVGQDFSLSHAEEDASLKTASVVVGGPALFLFGNIWVKLSAVSRLPVSHIAGLVALGLLMAAFSFLPTYALSLGATISLLVAATWEYAALRWPVDAPPAH